MISGEKYKGYFDRNFRHGKGVCSYRNGARYAGEWYRLVFIYMKMYVYIHNIYIDMYIYIYIYIYQHIHMHVSEWCTICGRVV
jgi:hypothetical protein